MNIDEIRYAIAKQTPSMEYIHTGYGDIELDSEMAEAVQEAIERVLYKRIDMLNAAGMFLEGNKPWEKPIQFTDQLSIASQWAEKQAKKS